MSLRSAIMRVAAQEDLNFLLTNRIPRARQLWFSHSRAVTVLEDTRDSQERSTTTQVGPFSNVGRNHDV